MRKLAKSLVLLFSSFFIISSCGGNSSDEGKNNEPDINQGENNDNPGGKEDNPGDKDNDKDEDNRKDVSIKFYDGVDVFFEAKGKEGDFYDTPKKPSKDGYVFIGWGYEDSLVKSTLPSTLPERDLTYKAIWKKEEYRLFFRFNSEFNGVYTFGDELPQAPQKTGLTFIGWQLSDFDLDPINKVFDLGESGTSYYLDAIYTDLVFTIHFETGSDISSTLSDIPNASLITELPKNVEIEEGKYLVGWSLYEGVSSDEEGIAKGDTLASMPYADLQDLPDYIESGVLTLFPVIEYKKFTLSFYDYDDQLIDTDTYTYGDALPNEENYYDWGGDSKNNTRNFLGWEERTTQTISKICEDYGENLAEVNLFAKVNMAEYKVQYSWSDSTISWTSSGNNKYGSSPLSVQFGDEMPGSDDIVKDQSTFLGWKSNSLKDKNTTYNVIPPLKTLVDSGIDPFEDVIVFTPVFSAQVIKFNVNYNVCLKGTKSSINEGFHRSPYHRQIINNDARMPDPYAEGEKYVTFQPNVTLPSAGNYGLAACGMKFVNYIILKGKSTKIDYQYNIPESYKEKSEYLVLNPGDTVPSLKTLNEKMPLQDDEVYHLLTVFEEDMIENIPVYENNYKYIAGNLDLKGYFKARYGSPSSYWALTDKVNDSLNYLDGYHTFFFTTSKGNNANKIYPTMYNKVTGAMKEAEKYFSISLTSYGNFNYSTSNDFDIHGFDFIDKNSNVKGLKADNAWYITRFLLKEVY
jgi:uncharacterized repeat protein (TIGR02543 family)